MGCLDEAVDVVICAYFVNKVRGFPRFRCSVIWFGEMHLSFSSWAIDKRLGKATTDKMAAKPSEKSNIQIMLIMLMLIKVTFAEHSISNGKNKVTKKPHSMVIFLTKVRRSYRNLSSQAYPARENCTWKSCPDSTVFPVS